MAYQQELTGDPRIDQALSRIYSILNQHNDALSQRADKKTVNDIVKMLDTRLSYLTVRQGVSEPSTIPPNSFILYSDKDNGNEWRVKFQDGSIYAITLNPISGGAT